MTQGINSINISMNITNPAAADIHKLNYKYYLCKLSIMGCLLKKLPDSHEGGRWIGKFKEKPLLLKILRGFHK